LFCEFAFNYPFEKFMRTPSSSAIVRAGLLLGSIFLAVAASAGSFNIAPIRSDLTSAHRTDVLTLTNAEAQPVVIQVHVYAWSQVEGAERLLETRELLVTPPVLQMVAGAEQIVRTALRRDADPHQELSYRVIFEEVPQAAARDFSGLQVALRLSVPVFVAPTLKAAVAEVHWRAVWLPTGELEVSAMNVGSGHLQVADFEVKLEGGHVSLHSLSAKYVLPGSRMAWQLKAPDNFNREAPLVLHGHSDRGDFSADIPPHAAQ
jgi:fimbrial chaperone protein